MQSRPPPSSKDIMGSFIAEAVKGMKVNIGSLRVLKADQYSPPWKDCQRYHHFECDQAELDTLDHLPSKLRRIPKLIGIILSEIAGMITLIPYAVTTISLYK